MPKIRIDLDASIINGQALTFKAPADCSDITGLVIYYPWGNNTTSKSFKFVDAHGVDVGSGTISLFAANALVKVVLDTDQGKAFVQNADTNAYLERKFDERLVAPTPTDNDEGKFLRVVDGVAAWAALPVYGGEIEVTSALGECILGTMELGG